MADFNFSRGKIKKTFRYVVVYELRAESLFLKQLYQICWICQEGVWTTKKRPKLRISATFSNIARSARVCCLTGRACSVVQLVARASSRHRRTTLLRFAPLTKILLRPPPRRGPRQNFGEARPVRRNTCFPLARRWRVALKKNSILFFN